MSGRTPLSPASGECLSSAAAAPEDAATVWDACDAGVLVFDASGVCLYANRCAGALLGATSTRALIGRRAPPELVDDVAASIASSDVRKRPQLAVERLDGTGGAWVSASVRPSDGGAVVTLIDLSVRRGADAENEFRKILLQAQGDASLDAILVVSPGSEFISCNRRFSEMWGVPDDIVASGSDRDALKMVLENVVDPESFISRVQYLCEHPSEESQDVIALRDGRTVDGYSAPVRDSAGAYYGRVWFFRDVTERLRVAAEREELLAREQAARVAAEEASCAKDEFFAVVSHELRTPLTAILGWARIVRRLGRTEAERERALAIIERNALAQAKLIEDLLDVSRAITGKIRLNVGPVELGAIVACAVESVQPAATAKGIAISLTIDESSSLTTGDEARLQQVAFNLVTNAIKFTPEGGRVNVSLSRSATAVELSVADDGIGIDANFLPHVFERLRQADTHPTTRNHGGLGLGLAIVRHLVELHGGTVIAESKGKGHGARFVVRLPVRALSSERRIDVRRNLGAAGVEGPTGTMPDLNGVRVLCVDDEADARELLTELLTGCGARVTGVPSADEALLALATEEFDVMVSDISMPDKDGFGLIAEVREGERRGGRQAMPAVALTAMAFDAVRDAASNAGFSALMTKPAEPLELARKVARAVGR